MALTIKAAKGLSEIGKRSINEDCIYPSITDMEPVANLYMVCDGVGGNAGGEVASKLACEKISGYFNAKYGREIDSHFIDATIGQVQKDFETYVQDKPELMKMASTLALLYINENNVLVAHMGDSRIYQFRKGKIIFKTKDHSLLNERLDSGALSEEDAKNFRKKSTIVKFLIAENLKKFAAEIKIIDNIKDGDIFLLCSDGVLQSFDDTALEGLFKDASQKSVDELLSVVSANCLDSSTDNYSALILEIKNDNNDTEQIETNKEDTKIIKPDTTSTGDNIVHKKETTAWIQQPLNNINNLFVKIKNLFYKTEV